MPIQGAIFSPSALTFAWITLGVVGVILSLHLRHKVLESLARTQEFYDSVPPKTVDEYRQYLSLLTEGIYQSRKYVAFAFCQLMVVTIGYFALWYPPRVPRSTYDMVYMTVAACALLAIELALDLVSVLAWRKTQALETLAELEYWPVPDTKETNHA